MSGVRKYSKIPSKGELIFIMIAAVVVGTVFFFLMPYMNVPVERADARNIEASFSEYKEFHSRRNYGKSSRVAYIMLYFSDCEPMEIDGVCISVELQERLEMLSEGERLSMLVHPNSDTVLELKAGDEILLEFDDSMQKFAREGMFFRVMGIVSYAAALYSLYRIAAKKYMRYIPT